jgi:hypothetical protein
VALPPPALPSPPAVQVGGSTPPTLDPLDFQPSFPPPNFLPAKKGGEDDEEDDSGHAESFITAHSDDTFPRLPADAVLAASLPSLSSLLPSESSSFVDRRWDSIVPHIPPSLSLQSGSTNQSDVLLSYKLESMAAEEKKKRKKQQHRQASSMFALKDVQVTRTCVLFGLGFIAPWCWLIGGWMPDASSPPHRKVRKGGGGGGGGGLLLPLWRDQENKQPFGRWFGLGYPVVAPSVKAVPEAPTLRLKPQFESAAMVGKRADPWVYPCRVAALTSGCLLLVALVVLTVLLVRNRW